MALLHIFVYTITPSIGGVNMYVCIKLNIKNKNIIKLVI